MGEVDLAREFATFTRSAWRLCSLDAYDVGDDESASLQAWRQKHEVVEPANGWRPILAAARRRGATVGRVQVLSRPLTPYAEWLLAIYPFNAASGEDVRVAFRDEHPDRLSELNSDFWLFDDVRVARMSYTADGSFLVAWDESQDIDHYRRQRDLALAVARPIGHTAVA